MGLIYKGFLKIFHKVWKNVEVEDQKRMKTLVLPDDVSFEDFKYGEDDDPYHTFSIYWPKDKDLTKLPILIDIHGGAWAYGDKELNRPFCMTMAHRNLIVMGMSYRLIEGVQVNNQLEDIINSINGFIKVAKERKYNLNNVFLTGDSAGGYFALSLASLLDRKLINPILGLNLNIDFKGLILNHPAFDFDIMGQTHFWYPLLFRAMFGKKYKKNPIYVNTKNTKVLMDNVYLPPMLFITSTGDDVMGEINIDVLKEIKRYYPNIEVINNDIDPKGHVYNVAYINSDSAIKTNDKILNFILSISEK